MNEIEEARSARTEVYNGNPMQQGRRHGRRKEGSIYEISAIPSASVVVLLRSGVKGHEVETGKVGRQIK